VEKAGLTLGMGMTEKQGGTDVRANVTKAERAGSSGFYRIAGHKWFMSAPMSDAFLVLAQAPEGLSCFLVPRILGDGSGNGFRFQRLKDKLGNRSNASAEVEFDGAIGEMVGDPGAGVKTIMDMVTLTRLDCAVASSAIMRAGLAEAVHHTRHRKVFGANLIDQPLMQRVMADMALDVAAATALSFGLARSFDEAAGDRGEAAFARVMTPVVKYWVCKLRHRPGSRRQRPRHGRRAQGGHAGGVERRGIGQAAHRAARAGGGGGRIAAHGGRADRRSLRRDAPGRPVAHDLRHAGRAPRRALDPGYPLSRGLIGASVDPRKAGSPPTARLWTGVNLNEWFQLRLRPARPSVGLPDRTAMRHLMTSFLALHWAAFFALLGWLCIDGGGNAAGAASGGGSGVQSLVPHGFSAPAAVAFLVVAVLFCWMFADTWLGGDRKADAPDDTARIAFVAAGAALSMVLLGGLTAGPAGFYGAMLCLTLLMVCYIVVLGERRATALAARRHKTAAAAIRSMAQGAAYTSLLHHISGRPDSRGGR
jgi:hypothetical protein